MLVVINLALLVYYQVPSLSIFVNHQGVLQVDPGLEDRTTASNRCRRLAICLESEGVVRVTHQRSIGPTDNADK